MPTSIQPSSKESFPFRTMILPTAPIVHSGVPMLSEKRLRYRRFVDRVATMFGSVRVFTYIPTIMTLIASAESTQYNLLTWFAWVLANLTLTVNIYEQNGRKFDLFVFVNVCNTLMCLGTLAVICYLR